MLVVGEGVEEDRMVTGGSGKSADVLAMVSSLDEADVNDLK